MNKSQEVERLHYSFLGGLQSYSNLVGQDKDQIHQGHYTKRGKLSSKESYPLTRFSPE